MEKNNNYDKYTFLMSVYYKDNPEWLEESINSMLDQTVQPDEVLILKDGKLTKELEEVLNKYKENQIIKVIGFEKNRGLGPVLADGVKLAKNELIARMDSDDICDKERCEKQLKRFQENEKIDIVGGIVTEFVNSIENIVSIKGVPENDFQIYKYAKIRNPFNHPTVMYKKQKVIEAGNYQDNFRYEDYDLWIRMLMKGMKGYNIQENLVYMRVGDNFYNRRGGMKYLKTILKFRKEQYNRGFYNRREYIKSIIPHIIVSLIPNSIRKIVYIKVLRIT